MKIREVIVENGTGSLAPGVARAMPTTWELPALSNQDPYLQYRMGVAMASARSGEPPSDPPWCGRHLGCL